MRRLETLNRTRSNFPFRPFLDPPSIMATIKTRARASHRARWPAKVLPDGLLRPRYPRIQRYHPKRSRKVVPSTVSNIIFKSNNRIDDNLSQFRILSFWRRGDESNFFICGNKQQFLLPSMNGAHGSSTEISKDFPKTSCPGFRIRRYWSTCPGSCWIKAKSFTSQWNCPTEKNEVHHGQWPRSWRLG